LSEIEVADPIKIKIFRENVSVS